MRTKKCGVYAALAAVLLIMAVLVMGCDGLFPGGITPQTGGEPQITPTAGMGAIRLTIDSGSNGRTIMPSAPPNFTSYTLTFAGVGIANHTATVNYAIGAAMVGGPYTVNNIPTGNYSSLSVNALVDTNIAATATYNTAFLIQEAPAPATAITVPALTWNTTTGSGFFAYAIGGVSTLNVADMDIKARTGGTTPSDMPIDLLDSNTSGSTPLPLATGVYNVDFELKSATYPLSVYYREILHIYGGLTSTSNHTFPNDIFPKPSSVGSGNITFTPPGIIPTGLLTFDAPVTSGTVTYTVVGGGTTTFQNGCVVTMADNATFELTITDGTNIEWFTQINGDITGNTEVSGTENKTLTIEAGSDTFTATITESGIEYDVPYYCVQVFSDEDNGLYFYVVIQP